MEMLYKREQGRNYLLLCAEDKTEIPDSQTEMIRRNKIPGLARLQVEWEDNLKYYRYDITGLQPISRLYEFKSFSEEEVRELFYQMAEILLEMEKYLLNRDNLMLMPDCLYRHSGRLQYVFFFYPEQHGEYRMHVKELARYLLEKSDNTDSFLTEVTLRFYRLCIAEEPGPEELLSCFEAGRDNQSNYPNNCQMEYRGSSQEENLEEECKSEKTEKKPADGEGTGNTKIRNFFHNLFFGKKLKMEDMWDELEPEYVKKREKKERVEENRIETKRSVEEPYTEVLYVEELDKSHPVLINRERNEKIQIKSMPFLVGNQVEAHYNPDFGGISRFHFQLEQSQGKYWITDLNSTNGTKVNGIMLEPNERKEIVQGDIIWAAGLLYEFLEFDIADKT